MGKLSWLTLRKYLVRNTVHTSVCWFCLWLGAYSLVLGTQTVVIFGFQAAANTWKETAPSYAHHRINSWNYCWLTFVAYIQIEVQCDISTQLCTIHVKLESGIFAFRLFVSTIAPSYTQFKKVSDLIVISCCGSTS